MPAAVAIPAIIGAAGVGTSVATGIMGANAARDAADTQAQAADRAAQLQYQASKDSLDFQKQVYGQTREDQAPYREAGVSALGEINSGLGADGYFNQDFGPAFSFTGMDLNNDPGYQFRLDEATKAIQRSAAAKGGLTSGATLKSLDRYTQDYASGEFQNAYNRAANTYQMAYNKFQTDRTNRFNRLASVAGLGQTANSTLAQSGANFANAASSNLLGTAANVGDLMTSAAAARASGYVGGTNAWTNALSGATNGIGNSLALWQLLNGNKSAAPASSTPVYV